MISRHRWLRLWCLRKEVAVRNQDPSKGVELVLPESWGLRGLLRAVPPCSTDVFKSRGGCYAAARCKKTALIATRREPLCCSPASLHVILRLASEMAGAGAQTAGVGDEVAG
jgi:hypothetical protein